MPSLPKREFVSWSSSCVLSETFHPIEIAGLSLFFTISSFLSPLFYAIFYLHLPPFFDSSLLFFIFCYFKVTKNTLIDESLSLFLSLSLSLSGPPARWLHVFHGNCAITVIIDISNYTYVIALCQHAGAHWWYMWHLPMPRDWSTGRSEISDESFYTRWMIQIKENVPATN